MNFNLEVINVAIEQLKKDSKTLIQTSAISGLLEAVFMAKKIEAIITGKGSSIKLTPTEKESILINAKSVINGVEKVAELNKEHMIRTEASELFVYLTL